jgi:hypothetical protein
MKKITLMIILLISSIGFSQALVTFKVDMSNYVGLSPTSIVYVNGTFNGWCGACNPMVKEGSTNIWSTTLPLPAGTIEYKFTVDEWVDQEALISGTSCTVTNGGFTNRSLDVGATDMTVPTVCWESCNSCSTTVPNTDVTFKVDMSNYEGLASTSTVYVNGTFNGWCGACNPMVKEGATNIWSTTLPLPAGTIEYKFTVDGWVDQEALISGTSCTVTNNGFTNRSLVIGSTALTVDTVCWESCNTCSTTVPNTDVTFKVDMSNYVGLASTSIVYVNGTFNGWCGACNPMVKEGATNIWSTTLPLPAGTIEYKFTVDGWVDQEALVSGTSCTVTNGGFTNRSLVIGSTALTVDTVCWESCNTCSTTVPNTDVTFKVDMSNYVGLASTSIVYVNGTFNGWCGACNPMVKEGATNIWSTTLPLPAGTIEYKFTVDEWVDQEALVSGTSCTVTNGAFTNRSLVIGSTALTVPTVCWESCNACVSVVAPLVAAPTPPARNAWDVISLFSDAYTNISIDNWNQAPIWYPPTGKPVLDVLVDTNPTKKIEFAGDGFIGVVLSSLTNATDMTHFHMDYWIPSGTDLIGKVLNPKFSNHALTTPVVGESNALLLTNETTTAGSWVSLDVAFSTFTAQAPVGGTPSLNREVLKEFLIQSNLGDVYIDNIYLYRAATASADTFNTSNVRLYPNPTSTSLTIEAKDAIENIAIYNVIGQEVISKNPMSNTMTLDVSNLQNGLYFVNTTIDGKTATTKFIKN